MGQRIQHLRPVRPIEPAPFSDHRLAALALLNSGTRLTRKAGQFLGQLAVDSTPMTPSQFEWLAKLLARGDLPPFVWEIGA